MYSVYPENFLRCSHYTETLCTGCIQYIPSDIMYTSYHVRSIIWIYSFTQCVHKYLLIHSHILICHVCSLICIYSCTQCAHTMCSFMCTQFTQHIYLYILSTLFCNYLLGKGVMFSVALVCLFQVVCPLATLLERSWMDSYERLWRGLRS